METLLSFVLFILAITLSQSSKFEQDLLHKLLTNYDVRIRPTLDPGDTVTVNMDLYLLKFTNVEKNYWDEVKGLVDISIWIAMGWNDSRLSWNPSDYGNTKKLIIPSKQVWLPDMILYTGEGAIEEAITGSDNYSVTVRPNGAVYYVFPVNTQMSCVHKTQKKGLRCSMSLESWTQANDMIHIVTTKNEVDTSLLGTYHDPSYKIERTSFEIKKRVYPDTPQKTYDATKATIYMEAIKIGQD